MKIITTVALTLLACNTSAQEVTGGLGRGTNLYHTGCGGQKTIYIIDGLLLQTQNPFPITAKPVIDQDYLGRHKLTREEISRMPTTNLNDLLTIFPGIYQQRRGDELNIYGSRSDGNHYYIDGMQ